jgi:heme/copper-type cytochrome/quinol oxidase subunit 2
MDPQTLQPPKRLGDRRAVVRPAKWIAVAGLAVTALVFPELPGPDPAERTIRVEASSFAFEPAVIEVNRGDRITLELASQDVVHGLYVDGYGVQLRADPGQTARLTFTADRSGSFRLRCSVTCGALHPFMIGKLSVGPNLPFLRGVALAVMSGVLTLWLLRR